MQSEGARRQTRRAKEKKRKNEHRAKKEVGNQIKNERKKEKKAHLRPARRSRATLGSLPLRKAERSTHETAKPQKRRDDSPAAPGDDSPAAAAVQAAPQAEWAAGKPQGAAGDETDPRGRLEGEGSGRKMGRRRATPKWPSAIMPGDVTWFLIGNEKKSGVDPG